MFRVRGLSAQEPAAYMSLNVNCLKGGYIGDYIRGLL